MTKPQYLKHREPRCVGTSSTRKTGVTASTSRSLTAKGRCFISTTSPATRSLIGSAPSTTSSPLIRDRHSRTSLLSWSMAKREPRSATYPKRNLPNTKKPCANSGPSSTKAKRATPRYLAARCCVRRNTGWLRPCVRCMAVGREQFYQGKTIAYEVWLVDRHYYEDRQWRDGCYGRLRVFSDGTADAWWAAGLFGFSDETLARRELSGAKYRPWEEIENELFDGHFLPEPPPPSAFTLDDSDVPFRYEG